MKYLFLLLLSFHTLADEVGVAYTRIHQKLDFKNPVDLKADAIQFSYAKFSEYNLGYRLVVARGTETSNVNYIENSFMTNKVYAMYQIQAVYKYEFNDKVNLLLACGLTEYHSKWRVNGVEPSWSRGVDSSKACMYGAQIDYTPKFSTELFVGKPYQKHKAGYGKEETYIISAGFIYRF